MSETCSKICQLECQPEVGGTWSSGGHNKYDEHRNSDSLEKVEAIPGCSSARNHNSHANMHACCAFVRGSLGSASHAQLRTRKIENCKKELETDCFKHGHVVGMYWENIARSMVERAHRDARQLDVPLFCLQAADQRHARKNKTIDKQLTHQLLTVPNPHRTGKLQGMLLVHENMIVRLSDVLAPHLGLVKDKMAMVVKVDLHHEDQERLRHREAGFCHFVPEYMAKGIWVKLLKGKSSPMEDALLETWEGQFENVADHTDDAKTLFFVELMHADFKIDLKIGEENEKIEVIRWQFPLLHGMLRTAYSAQGLTLDGGVLVDLRRAGGLEDDDWWLAIYVMLTRARKLENLILLGMTDQVEDLLRRGPPAYLRELTDKLESQRCFHVGALAELASVWLSANFLTPYSAFGFNRLSAERSVGIRDGWTLWRSTDMFDAFCLSYWYVDRWYPDMIWHVWCRECFLLRTAMHLWFEHVLLLQL